MLSALFIGIVGAALAHEVIPTIGDMERKGDRLVFALEGNFESIVAGIDLEGLSDTEVAPEAAVYDELRELAPAEFAAQLQEHWPHMNDAITILVDGVAAPLTLAGVDVRTNANLDVPRASILRFEAALPDNAQMVQIEWPRQYGDLVLRQQGVEAGWDGILSGGGLSEPVSLSGGDEMTGLEAFTRFIPVGVAHIVPLGLDHILFVLGLFFLSTRAGPLLWQITAFTAAHTVTLALATLGYVSIADEHMWIVESVIAASIVYVAVENIFTEGLNPWRPVVIFCFGLLHGLGFASVLGAYGLPEGAVLPALLGFNLGVELGQLLCISVAFILVAAAMRLAADGIANRGAAIAYLAVAILAVPLAMIPISAMGPEATEAYLPLLFMIALLAGLSAASCAVARYDTYRHMVAMPASIAIALVGAYWVVERIFL